MERLDKILAHMGFGTRREVKQLIKSGAVSVNGSIAADADLKIDPNADELCVNGKTVRYRKYIYLMLNKPQGFISATFDKRHRTVAELVPPELAHTEPFPVGRLDIDTEGLLIMTNDGDLAHRALSPKNHISKVYYAELDADFDEGDIEAFRDGIIIDGGYKTLPAVLEREGGGARVTIYEGKFHQIKQMFERRGKNVTYLKRVQMGGLPLDETLEPGEIREITEEELDSLWKK